MQLLIESGGRIRCVYGEKIDLNVLGPLKIRRASHVEPDHTGRWSADLTPVGGPVLGPYSSRGEALAAENDWLEQNWLMESRRAVPLATSPQ
ncbi:MAG TPA: hypothetical protein DD670_13485 [Planctomycetaceae bacterium]|nr:hypothetical protein [Planctomycetaceae bacterium]